MPTRKQRRRKAKELRHDYVWEDEEGNELDPEDVPGRKSSSSSERHSTRPARRSAREPQPPSWRRTLKRAVVFAPVMFLVVMFLSDDLTLADQIVQTALIVGIFVPFSYLIDGLLWRTYKRRESRDGGHRS